MRSALDARVAPFLDGDDVLHVVRANAGVHPLVPAGATLAVLAVVTAATALTFGTSVMAVAAVGAVIGAVVATLLTPLVGYRLLAVTDGSVVSLRTARFRSTRPTGVVGRDDRFAQSVTETGDFRRVECAGELLWVHERFVAHLVEPEAFEPADPEPATVEP